MSEDLDKPFMYQINWNRRKYPEEIAALEQAKKENGIAWYLRQLIRKDIEEKKKKGYKFDQAHQPEVEETITSKPKKEGKIGRPTEPEERIELPDDSGGFL
jgi:hypothetical protein